MVGTLYLGPRMMQNNNYPNEFSQKMNSKGKRFRLVSENVREDVYERYLHMIAIHGQSRPAIEQFFDTQLRRESRRDQARSLRMDCFLHKTIDSKMCNSVLLACAFEGNLKSANEILSTMNVNDTREGVAPKDKLINGLTYAYMSCTYRHYVFSVVQSMLCLYQGFNAQGALVSELQRYVEEVNFYEAKAVNFEGPGIMRSEVLSVLTHFEMRFPRGYLASVINHHAACIPL